MKKIILVFVMAFTFSFVNAQEKKESSFGVKAGLNLATITNADGSSTLSGYNLGFFGEFMLDENFSLQPEITYSVQGAKFSPDDVDIHYINIPVLVKYYPVEAFSLEFGPQLGFLVSAESGGETVKSLFKSTDFGVDFGAGYDITKNLVLGIRYNLGIERLQKDLASGEKASRNSVFQLNLGYKF